MVSCFFPAFSLFVEKKIPEAETCPDLVQAIFANGQYFFRKNTIVLI